MAAIRKILLVSEMLGTPADGVWRDYSIALVEALARAGAEITLVVEQSFRLDSAATADEPTRRIAVLDYLANGVFDPRLFYQNPAARLLALHAPALLARRATRASRRSAAVARPFPNDPAGAGMLPRRVAHLRAVSRFLPLRRVYSSARLRAVYDTGPEEVDGAGYDLVVVDGLLPIRVANCPAARLVTIVHDPSPFVAASVRPKPRRIGGQGLVALLERGGTALFASEHAQGVFRALGLAPGLRQGVLGPIVPDRVRGLVGEPRPVEPPADLGGLARRAAKEAFERAMRPDAIMERLLRDVGAAGPGDAPAADCWDPSRPLAVVVWPGGLHDDVTPLAGAARELRGIANLLALGILPPPPPPPMVVGTRPDEAAPEPPDLPLNLHLAGRPPEADRVAYLRYAALLILPHPSGAGAALLEALALARRTLCADHPGNREHAGGHAAYFDATDPGGMATAIRALLAAPDGEIPSPAAIPPRAETDGLLAGLLPG